MLIHDLIEKLQELATKNPKFECRVSVHDMNFDGEGIHAHSDELPRFEFDESDPDYVMIDFYSPAWDDSKIK